MRSDSELPRVSQPHTIVSRHLVLELRQGVRCDRSKNRANLRITKFEYWKAIQLVDFSDFIDRWSMHSGFCVRWDFPTLLKAWLGFSYVYIFSIIVCTQEFSLCFASLLWPCCDGVVAMSSHTEYGDSRKLLWRQSLSVRSFGHWHVCVCCFHCFHRCLDTRIASTPWSMINDVTVSVDFKGFLEVKVGWATWYQQHPQVEATHREKSSGHMETQ